MSASRPRALTTYLDAAGNHERLSADQERAATRELTEARRACWRAAMSNRGRLRRAVAATCRGADQIDEGVWKDADALVSTLDSLDPERGALDHFIEDRAVGRSTRQATAKAQRGYRRLRNEFMCRNLRLVVTVAKRFGRLHMPLADRVQEGNLGLIKAVDRFDPERGTRFSTYAAWWIRHTVTRALMNHGRTVRVPGHLHAVFNKVRKARRTLSSELDREPSVEEVANRIDIAVERVAAAIDAMELRSVTLDAPANDQDGRTLGESIADERAQEWTSRVERSIDVPLAAHALGSLDCKAQHIVRHRYGLEDSEVRTLRDLGEDYGVSRERIRQLQVRALDEIRTQMERGGLPSVALA